MSPVSLELSVDQSLTKIKLFLNWKWFYGSNLAFSFISHSHSRCTVHTDHEIVPATHLVCDRQTKNRRTVDYNSGNGGRNKCSESRWWWCSDAMLGNRSTIKTNNNVFVCFFVTNESVLRFDLFPFRSKSFYEHHKRTTATTRIHTFHFGHTMQWGDEQRWRTIRADRNFFILLLLIEHGFSSGRFFPVCTFCSKWTRRICWSDWSVARSLIRLSVEWTSWVIFVVGCKLKDWWCK